MARPKKQRGTQYQQNLDAETVAADTLAAGASEIGTAEIAALAVTTAKLAADAVDGTKLADNAVDSEHITAGAVDAAHMSANSIDSDSYVDGSIDNEHLADNVVDNDELATRIAKHLKFQYDFADLGGAQGAITLTDDADAAQTIPDNAVIVRATLEGITTATSGGAATVALGYTGNTDAFIAATAYNNGEFNAAVETNLTAEIPIKTTAAVSVLATIASADLTAGKFNIWIEYYEGD